MKSLYFLAATLLVSLVLTVQPTLPKHVIPLHGNASLGYYYANLYVGNPPQQQSVIVDTGSGQLALPCSKCQSCGTRHIHPPFRLSDSKTSSFVTCNSEEEICRSRCAKKDGTQACTFSISYAEGSSLSGIIIQDDIQFEGGSKGESIRAAFGCTTKETNLFYTQAANGIFGLAPMRQAKLLQKLYEQHSKLTGQELLFSMCLSKNGGQLVIGKSQADVHLNNNSVKTKFIANRNLYSLDGVGEIRLGNKVLKNKNQHPGTFGVFIDSGSTFSYLPRLAFNGLLTALQNTCANNGDKCLIAQNKGSCFKITPEPDQTIMQTVNKIFPSFDIEVGSEVISWLPADYFLLRSLKNKQVCLGIEQLDRYILGANWMVNRDIVFNLKQGTVQIFSQASCVSQDKRIPLLQEMTVYTGTIDNEEFSYINAVFRQDSRVVGIIVIVVSIVGFVLICLALVGKICSEEREEVRERSQQDQVTEERAMSEKASERSNQKWNRAAPESLSEKIQIISISQEAINLQQEPSVS